MHTRSISALIVASVIVVTPAVVLGRQAPAPATPAAAAFAKGVALHDAGKAAEAISLFRQAIDLGYLPVNQARFRLARAYAKAGQTEPALVELEALAAAGFPNIPALATPDFDALRALPRFKAFESRVNTNARPCENDPLFRQFDFWIGEWDVQPTANPRTPIGTGATSIIELHLGGCVVQENWLAGSTVAVGKSFNVYNRATRMWEQYYVDTSGAITHYKGAFKEDGNLYLEAERPGTTNRVRMTFFNQGPNQVRQLGHASSDGGKTWTVTFDLTYVRKKAVIVP